jgi:hypothetical protein
MFVHEGMRVMEVMKLSYHNFERLSDIKILCSFSFATLPAFVSAIVLIYLTVCGQATNMSLRA